MVLEKRGYTFESETDTEAVAVLCKYIWDSQPTKRLTFNTLIKAVIKELEGSFAFVFKSIHFPSEIVMARRGSPLLIGVKTDKKLKVDFVDVEVAPDSDKLETSEWGSRMRGRKRVSEALTLVLLPPPPKSTTSTATLPSSPFRPRPTTPTCAGPSRGRSSRTTVCLSRSSSSSPRTPLPSSSTPSASSTSRTTTSLTSPREVRRCRRDAFCLSCPPCLKLTETPFRMAHAPSQSSTSTASAATMACRPSARLRRSRSSSPRS